MSQWFIEDAVETLIQETIPTSSKKDFFIWEVAMVHLLIGYPNLNHFTCSENVRINQKVWELDSLVKRIREEYHL